MKQFTYNGYKVYIAEKGDLSVRLLQTSGRVLPLSKIISTEGEVVSITNCSYFFSDGGYYYTNGRNQGDTLNTTYADAANGGYCDVCIYEDGSWYAGKFNNWDHTANYRDVENGVCAGFSAAGFLVLDGQDVEILSAVSGFNVTGKFTARNPQTAFAILSNGNMLQIVSEGRNATGNGLTGHELLAAVRAQGYDNISMFALLDGGGSSEMIVNGTVVNTLSDGSERSMLNGIAFVDIESPDEPGGDESIPTPDPDPTPTPEPDPEPDPTPSLSSYSLKNAKITLSQTSFEFTGYECNPTVTVVIDEYTLIEGVDYTLEYKNNIEIGQSSVTAKGINNFTDSKKVNYEITAISIIGKVDLIWENEASMCVYSGQEYTPGFDLYYQGTLMIEGRDYVKAYFENIDAGRAYVRIAGKGMFEGEFIDFFTIWRKDITEINFTLEDAEYVFTGEKIVPNFTLTYNGMALEEERDYLLDVKDNIDVGIASMMIEGVGNYIESFIVNFEIKQKEITSPDVTTNVMNTPVYTGKPILPELVVKCNNKLLQEGIDYTLKGENNIDAGIGYLIITGINNFSEEKTIPFDIAKKNLSDTDININYEDRIEYTGLEIIPEVNIVYNDNVLEMPEDYTYTASNNIDVSDVAFITITAALTSNYTGSVKKYFSIIAATGATFEVVLEAEEFEYTGSEIKPALTVYHDGIEYKQYTTEFKNNVNVAKTDGEIVAAAEVKITIAGNYTGSITKYFKILPVDAGRCQVNVNPSNNIYTGKEINPLLKITFNDKIVSASSYLILGYTNNINVTKDAIVLYRFVSDNFIETKENREAKFAIIPASIGSCNVTLTPLNFKYNGDAKEPSIKLTLNGINISKEEFEYSYSNNIDAGTNATVVLTGKNNLTGTKRVFFTINKAVLTEENCIISAEEYEPNLYNMATLKVEFLKDENTKVLLEESKDYGVTFVSENNLNLEVVQTTATVSGVGNFTGIVVELFDTSTLTAGDMSDILTQIDKKPGYTYIQYSDAMEGMFKISSQGKSAIDELNTQLYNHGYVNESATINTIPIYYLKPNTLVYIRDEETKVNGEYIIQKIDIPLGNNGTMSITATKAMKRLY